MKKLLTLSLLCLGLLNGAKAQTCGTTITTYPYLENFDGATAPGWVSGGTNSSWALGTPAKIVINSAASGTKAWVTSLPSAYNNNEQSFVESPCFNMSTLIQPVIEMKIWWNSEFNFDGAVLQSSIDGGTTWQVVGAKGDPNNWYNNYNTISAAPGGQPAATAQGWTGRTITSNGSNGWVTAKHVLTGLAGKANVKLRIAFGSQATGQDEGFAFDNFAIYESPANDASISAIITPITAVTPGVSQPVQVTLKNFGVAALTSATIGWSVNGVAQANYSWTGSLAFLASSAPVNIGNYTFPAGNNYTLKVWSKNPNAASDGLAANDTTSLRITSCAPMSGSYTINMNNPTAGTNFQSITAAAQQLSNCGVSGPVTITVTSGTGPYMEQVEILNIPYASATNTVTFEGSGNTVSATPVGKPGIFVLNGAKYVKLNNFVITLPPAINFGWGVQLMNAADFNTISNNTINLSTTSVSVNLIGIGSGASNLGVGNNASNTKIQNNIINGGQYGIQINGNTGGLNANNNQVIDNQIRDSYQYGIYVTNANGTLIEKNDISRPTRTTGPNLYNIYLAGLSQNTIVSKNRMHNAFDVLPGVNSLYGVYTIAAATPGNENIIKNNAIYNLNNANGTVYAFYNSNANGTYYYNNTVATDPAISYKVLRGLYVFAPATNVKFINNIVSLPSVVTGTKYAINVSAITATLESNHNDLYIGTTGNIGYYGAAAPTLANWKAINSNAFDQASVSADPIFANPATGDLKPTAGATDNFGQALTAVTDDILGTTRHATTPDLGAYEFGVPANDVGIMSISVSNASGCGLTSAETISVTIMNHSSIPQPAVPVMFSVNGVPMAATPETYNASPIAPSTSATYTFTAKANLVAAGNYQIIAKTQLTGDLVTNNDADTITVTNPLVSTLPVNFDFETPATGISFFRKETRSKSNIVEHVTATSPFVTTSTKGMILAGVTNSAWTLPAVAVDPWTINPNHFAGAFLCVNPTGGSATDSLWLTFDMKQLFKTANANTNFRVTINGTQVGPTYRPPFDPTLPATPNNWRHIKVDLTAFKNASSILIGLESNVMQEFANGTGSANLIDNVSIVRRLVLVTPTTPTGMKENGLAAKVSVYPNPSNGLFKVSLPAGKAFTLEVTDLTGKVLQRQKTVGETELKLQSQAKGIYLLKVSGENGSAVRKLVIE